MWQELSLLITPVDNRLTPPLKQPSILPTVDLCLSNLSDTELAERIDRLANDAATHADPTPAEAFQGDRTAWASSNKIENAQTDNAIAQAQAEQPCDRITEAQAVESPVADSVQIWNPAPTDIHAEVQQSLGAIALEGAKAKANDSATSAVPGATGDKPASKASTSKAKASTGKAGAKAKPNQDKGEARAIVTPRRRRARV